MGDKKIEIQDVKGVVQNSGTVNQNIIDKVIHYHGNEDKNLKEENLISQRKKKIFLTVFVLSIIISFFIIVQIRNKPKLIFKEVQLVDKLFIDFKAIEEMVSSPMYYRYIQHRIKNSKNFFDFRGIFYHEEIIFPKENEEKIKNEIKNYIFFLKEEIKKDNNILGKLYKFDNIKITTIFYEYLGNNFNDNFTVLEQKEKLKCFFKNDILKLKKQIDILKNNFKFYKRKYIRLHILNQDSIDRLIKNSALIKYKNRIFNIYRIRKPLSQHQLMSIPISSGNSEESYDKEAFKIILKKSITELWYSFKDNIKICELGGYYSIVMYNQKNKLIKNKIQCEKEE